MFSIVTLAPPVTWMAPTVVLLKVTLAVGVLVTCAGSDRRLAGGDDAAPADQPGALSPSPTRSGRILSPARRGLSMLALSTTVCRAQLLPHEGIDRRNPIGRYAVTERQALVDRHAGDVEGVVLGAHRGLALRLRVHGLHWPTVKSQPAWRLARAL